MPAKKGSKKKGSSSTGGAEAIPFKYEPPDLSDLVKPTYCCCRVCNCNGLPHLNFEWPVVETNVTLAQVCPLFSAQAGLDVGADLQLFSLRVRGKRRPLL